MEHDADVVAIGTGTGPAGETVPAVILAVREECLPIFVSPDQAQSIGMALEGEPFERPLSHDLLLELLTEFGGAVNRVRIDDLIDGTFYAKVDVERYEEGRPERFVFDARPSDALALAVRVDCPIVVTDEVVEEAGQPPEVVGFDVADQSGGGPFEGSGVDPSSAEDLFDDPPSDVEEEFEDVLGDEAVENAGEDTTEPPGDDSADSSTGDIEDRTETEGNDGTDPGGDDGTETEGDDAAGTDDDG